MVWFKSLWEKKPLQFILLLALVLRLIAVIFSKGYGMHDDHFLVIETAQSWFDGAAYNNWFLERETGSTPTILNFFYAGLHYIMFYLLESIGITDPQAKMYFVRFLHALWSLLIVYYGYKITEKLADQKTAKTAGIILAALWIMPFMGVHNLVEAVCIPFLLAGYWYLYTAPLQKRYYLSIFFPALLFGLSFTLRFQTILIPVGIGIALLFRNKWLECLAFGSGILLIILLTHGFTDWLIWGEPFKELQVYVSHNIDHRFDYTVSPWYTYMLVILGVLVPPVSLMLFAGYFKTWRKHAMFFFPILLFLVFHSYFPNKQERFIFPILPAMVILGTIGWKEITEKFTFWRRNPKMVRGAWIFFWVVNIFLLALFTTMYSKKARIESMTYLAKYSEIKALVTEDSNRGYASMLPLFYLEQWPEVYTVSQDHPITGLENAMRVDTTLSPSFVLFFDSKNLESRLESMKKVIPGLVPEAVIEPGLMDRILHRLNPVNANQQVFIYRNTRAFPKKL
jgi:4-amino-4-deoxy-L-arabinose transferase-like glycosyltransferase